jgi:hypothetical protein
MMIRSIAPWSELTSIPTGISTAGNSRKEEEQMPKYQVVVDITSPVKLEEETIQEYLQENLPEFLAED